MKQTSLTTGDWYDIVDSFPSECLAMDRFFLACVLLPLGVTRRLALLGLASCPLALLEDGVALLGVGVLFGVNDDRSAASILLHSAVRRDLTKFERRMSTHRVVFNQVELSGLEDENETEQDEEVAPPEIGGVQTKSSAEILPSGNNGVSWYGAR